MLMSARRDVEQRQDGQAALMQQIEAWRGLIDRADYLFKRDVLDLLDVRVRFIAADSGFTAAGWSSPRAIEITTALTKARAFEYVMERRWRKQQKAAWRRMRGTGGEGKVSTFTSEV